MPEEERLLESSDSLQESREQALRTLNGGVVEGAERGLRIDLFEHDDPDEELPCLCDLPEHAQDLIIEDIEYEEGNA
jgi:hypothetical protein|tara:strand:+ start:211 stop:441 length:231 start_codon:yes stop_codon:yes gene_type:complete